MNIRQYFFSISIFHLLKTFFIIFEQEKIGKQPQNEPGFLYKKVKEQKPVLLEQAKIAHEIKSKHKSKT